MQKNLLKMARHYKREGFEMAQQGLQVIWSVVVQNLSADAELTEEQTAKLVKIYDEVDRVLRGFREMDMTPVEFSEYMTLQGYECAERLRGEK